MFFGELVVWCYWPCDWKVYRDFKTQDSLSLTDVRALRTQKRTFVPLPMEKMDTRGLTARGTQQLALWNDPSKTSVSWVSVKKQKRALLLDPRNKHILTLEHNRRQWFKSVSLQVKWRCDNYSHLTVSPNFAVEIILFSIILKTVLFSIISVIYK